MPTPAEHFASLTSAQLQELLSQSSDDFTAEALSAAREELARRQREALDRPREDSVATRDTAPPPEPPNHRLFSLFQIVVASLLGALFGGAVLVSTNFQRLGRTKMSWSALILGLITTFGFGLAADARLFGLGPAPILLIGTVGVAVFAGLTQAPAIRRHGEQGGQYYSLWLAAALGLSSGALIVGLATAIAEILA